MGRCSVSTFLSTGMQLSLAIYSGCAREWEKALYTLPTLLCSSVRTRPKTESESKFNSWAHMNFGKVWVRIQTVKESSISNNGKYSGPDFGSWFFPPSHHSSRIHSASHSSFYRGSLSTMSPHGSGEWYTGEEGIALWGKLAAQKGLAASWQGRGRQCARSWEPATIRPHK